MRQPPAAGNETGAYVQQYHLKIIEPTIFEFWGIFIY